MPFNFRAHHSHRHCSGRLLYSHGKCSGEEVGGNGEVAGDYRRRGVLKASMWMACVCRVGTVGCHAGHRIKKGTFSSQWE